MLSQKQLKNCNLYDMLVLLPSLKEAQVKHDMVGYPSKFKWLLDRHWKAVLGSMLKDVTSCLHIMWRYGSQNWKFQSLLLINQTGKRDILVLFLQCAMYWSKRGLEVEAPNLQFRMEVLLIWRPKSLGDTEAGECELP